MIGQYYIDELVQKAKKLPGVALFSSIIIVLMGYHIDEFNSNLTYLFLIYFLSVVLFYFSGIFDNLLFNSIFGINKTNFINKYLTKELNILRQKALESFNPAMVNFDLACKSKYQETLMFVGLYGTAKTILKANGKWDMFPKFLLDISKSSRSLFFLLFGLILLWTFKPNFLMESTIEDQESIFIIIKKYRFYFLVLFLIVAQLFRYLHLRIVYKLTSNNNWQKNILQLNAKNNCQLTDYLAIKHVLLDVNQLSINKERKLYKEIYDMIDDGKTKKEIEAKYDKPKSKINYIIKTKRSTHN